MYIHIVSNNQKKRALLCTSNPGSVFVETFVQKCDDYESTHSAMEGKCKFGHSVKPFIRKGSCSMFNIFAKNLISSTWIEG